MDDNVICLYEAYNLFPVSWPAVKTFLHWTRSPVGLSYLHSNSSAVVLNHICNFKNADSPVAFNSLDVSFKPSICKIYLEVL